MNPLTTTDAAAVTASGPSPARRGSPLLAAHDGRRGHLSRPADPRRRGFPGLASAPLPSPHCTPVPTPAHPTLRAIRVRRSPR
jgi:hypothetical protein